MSTRLSLVGQIIRSFADFRGVLREDVQRDGHDARSLFYLMVAMLVVFVGGLPKQALQSGAEQSEFSALVGLWFVSTFFVRPLALYGVAGLAHLIAKWFGGTGTYSEIRLGFFWALVVVSPFVLMQGGLFALGLFLGSPSLLWLSQTTDLMIGVAVIWFWSVTLSQIEGFGSALRVFITLIAILAALAFGIFLAAGGAG